MIRTEMPATLVTREVLRSIRFALSLYSKCDPALVHGGEPADFYSGAA